MNVIEKVEVNGFRMKQKIEFSLHNDANFIIGRNGSGKTTLVNLLNAALTADLVTLETTSFYRIVVLLREVNSDNTSSITVAKTRSEKRRFADYKFFLRGPGSVGETYSINEPDDDVFYDPWIRRMHGLNYSGEQRTLRHHLKKLTNSSWLSVHRIEPLFRQKNRLAPENEEYESSIDRKIAQMSRKFTEFLSGLSSRASAEKDNFQQEFFLSLLHETKDTDKVSEAIELNFEEEKEALETIFKEFRMTPERFQDKLTGHFDYLKHAVKRFKSDSIKRARSPSTDSASPRVASDYLILNDTMRIHRLVEKWYELIEKQKDIFKPRDTLISTLNEMFIGSKQVSVSEKNQIVVKIDEDKEISLNELSSGEKQLFILLGETVLQEENPWIFIADEPELSLHVEWQVGLVPNLRKINPNAQIIFATHSPDIVGQYQDRIIDMEELLK